MSRKTVLLFPGQGAFRARYATALEYPVEVYSEDMELEADLGVDSVKQTELLSHAADRYQLPALPTDFRLSDYSTMGKVADSCSAPHRPGHIVRRRFPTAFGLTTAGSTGDIRNRGETVNRPGAAADRRRAEGSAPRLHIAGPGDALAAGIEAEPERPFPRQPDVAVRRHRCAAGAQGTGESGAEQATHRQRALGKMTARERLDALLDEGSFVEIGLLARHRASGFGLERNRPDTDGVVTGWGTVDGRKVFVYAHDFRIFGGSLGEVFATQDPHADGPRGRDRRAGHRAQRRRRRPDPGGHHRAGGFRRHLRAQREPVGRRPADLGDPRALRRRCRLLARAHRLRVRCQGQDQPVHHRSGCGGGRDRREDHATRSSAEP